MKKHLLVYGAGYALNRGAAIFILPFATHTLSLAEFGYFTLSQVLIQLVHPFICLNGSEAIVREGAVNPQLGRKIFWQYFLLTIFISLPTLLLAWSGTPTAWVKFALAIACVEAFHLLILAWWRTEDRFAIYGLFTSLKSFGLLMVFLLCWHFQWGLAEILAGQLLWYTLLFIGFLAPTLRQPLERTSIAPYFMYAFVLLPNGLCQWLLSSADRFLIQWLYGPAAVGEYSIGYSLAMVIMFVNAGLGLGLPPLVFRNYEEWIRTSTRSRVFTKTTILLMILYTLLVLAIDFDTHYTHIIAVYPAATMAIVSWTFAGLFLMSFYYLYSNYIFYLKKPKPLFVATAAAALINIVLTYLLLYPFHILGAAMATFFAYLFLAVATILLAFQLEKRLQPNYFELTLATVGLAYIFLLPTLKGSY